jgi:glycerol kinase
MGSGLYSSIEETKKFWKLNKSFIPEMKAKEIENYRNGWNKAIKRTIL